jgi:ferrous iron transport protein A
MRFPLGKWKYHPKVYRRMATYKHQYILKERNFYRMDTLKDVKIGKKAKVVKLHGEGAIKRRIMDMGITKGVEITVHKVAPLGDPLQITVRGYELSLRKADAEMIEVAPL